MIYLQPNTAAQNLYLSLDEGRIYFTTAFTNYLFVLTREENSNVGVDLAQVATVVLENERYTQIRITTIPLTSPGRYRYEVYGQNSATNLDPLNALVVGLVERGWCHINDTTTYFTQPALTLSDDNIQGV